MRILLVEDDALLGDGTRNSLNHLGFTADWVQDGAQALHALAAEHYDAVVLDLGLPRQDGFEVLRTLRGSGASTPVLILSAREQTQDKLHSFGLGADDYVVKPVDMAELAARLHALIRRSAGHASPHIRIGAVTLDPAAREVLLDGQPVELSAREFAVLEQLMQNAGRVMTRAQLEQGLYGWSEGADSNTVEVFIHHLRKKLGNGFIETLRGIGYTIRKPA